MKSLLNLLFCAVLVAGMAQSAKAAEAPPRDQGPIYVTTYYEVAPANAGQALDMLKEYRGGARAEPGAMSSEILQEAGMPSRFVTNEVWKDWAAYDAHVNAAARSRLFIRMRPIQFGPPDARTHLFYAAVPDMGMPGPNSVVILSHLDVTPNAIPKLMDSMKPLVEGSAKDAGVQKYQLLRQVPGAGNHFRVFEVWASERAWDAHNAQAHTLEFRNDLLPMLGTPYDQRKYAIVN